MKTFNVFLSSILKGNKCIRFHSLKKIRDCSFTFLQKQNKIGWIWGYAINYVAFFTFNIDILWTEIFMNDESNTIDIDKYIRIIYILMKILIDICNEWAKLNLHYITLKIVLHEKV